MIAIPLIVFCLSTSASGSHITEVAVGMKDALESRGSTVDTSSGGSGEHGLLTKEDRVKLEKGLRAIEYLKNLRSMTLDHSFGKMWLWSYNRMTRVCSPHRLCRSSTLYSRMIGR